MTDNVVQEIEKVNSSSNLYNLSCNQDEVINIIQFLKDNGVNCVDELLIYKIDLFCYDVQKFQIFKTIKIKLEIQNMNK